MRTPDKTLYSDRIRDTRQCPECGAPMHTTGRMDYYQTPPPYWVLEYHCDRDDENFYISTPETNAVAEKLAAQIEREKG